MSDSKLPTEKHVQSLLTNLFGDDVPVRVVDPPNPSEESKVIASYVDDEGTISKLFVCDLAFACRVGAALTRIPAGTVDETVKAGEMPDNIRENLHEVLNICVNLFPAVNGTHMVLDKIVISGSGEEQIAIDSTERDEVAAFEVDIPRYGQGILSLKQMSASSANTLA